MESPQISFSSRSRPHWYLKPQQLLVQSLTEHLKLLRVCFVLQHFWELLERQPLRHMTPFSCLVSCRIASLGIATEERSSGTNHTVCFNMKRFLSTQVSIPLWFFLLGVILWVIRRWMYLVFIPNSSTEHTKPFGISLAMRAIKASFVLSMRWVLGWGLVASGANHVIRRLELLCLPTPPPPVRTEGLEIEFNHQWPMI